MIFFVVYTMEQEVFGGTVMFRIAICDDNSIFLTQFKNTVTDIIKNLHSEYEISCFTSITELLQKMKDGISYHLLFLDIEFSNSSNDGIYVADFIRNELSESDIHIVFISNQPKYAMKLFDYQPLHFLIKPINQKQLTDILSKSLSLWNCNNQTLQFISNREKITLKIKHIIYIESFGRKKLIHCTSNKTYEINISFENLLKQLQSYDFISPHKSFIINYNKVIICRKDSVIMENGDELPIGRSQRKNFQEFQLQHALKQEG